MADAEVDFRQGKELGAEIVRAMQAWGDGSPMSARVALFAVLDALLKTLETLPEERRRVHAREFAETLLKAAKLSAKVVDIS